MTTPTAEARVRRPHRAVVLTISLLIAALVATGCTGGSDGDGDRDGGGGAGDRGGREVALDVRVAQVAGPLARPHRARTARQVGGVVDAWFEAAYLGGDYPRRRFGRSWPHFTRDARRQAAAHKGLTSNAGIGHTLRSVQPVRKQVAVDILTWKRRPHAATARFTLVFDATQEKRTSRQWVKGRLMLVLDQKRKKWRVVGFDVSRSSKVTGGGRA